MTLYKTILSLAVLLTSSVAFAQGTYVKLDVPGAATTAPFAINKAGDISGSYSDAISPYQHGFLFQHGNFTTIDYPGHGTDAYGLNDRGQVVGFTAEYPGIGFVYDAPSQTFATLTCNGFPYLAPTAINDSGVIVGGIIINQYSRSFELTPSRCRTIIPVKRANSAAYGISTSGVLVGSINGTVTGNYAYASGTVRKLVLPEVVNPYVTGISPDGTTLVGCSVPPTGGNTGFLLRGQNLTVLKFPGAPSTCAVGVNDAGAVVGYFDDKHQVSHGFTWIPPTPAEKK
jgi:probable HAF family extracellular repeat protein